MQTYFEKVENNHITHVFYMKCLGNLSCDLIKILPECLIFIFVRQHSILLEMLSFWFNWIKILNFINIDSLSYYFKLDFCPMWITNQISLQILYYNFYLYWKPTMTICLFVTKQSLFLLFAFTLTFTFGSRVVFLLLKYLFKL